MGHKKMLMKLLEDYQPFMYNHYVQDDIKNYAYLNEVADAILNLNKAFISGRSEQVCCPHCKSINWDGSGLTLNCNDCDYQWQQS